MMTRGGRLAEEVLWMNYPEPVTLHDYRYLGADFRERQRIKRKTQRWTRRLQEMPDVERYAMLAALEQLSDRRAGNDDGRSHQAFHAIPDEFARAASSAAARAGNDDGVHPRRI